MNTPIDCVITENEYGFYCVPKSMLGQPVINELMHNQVYESRTLGHILDNCGNGVIIHAGAFIGDMLPALGQLKNRVFAFEPSMLSYRCAEMTMKLNFKDGEHNIKLKNKGLGSEYLTGIPMVSGRGEGVPLGGESRVLKDAGATPADQLEYIDITTIDFELASPKGVSVIHLDIEGFEEEALKGATKTLRESLPMLILEVASDQYVETPFYEDFIFGELGYVEVERHRGNRVYIVP